MKLIDRYNRFSLPVLLIVFAVSSIITYFLIRHVVQRELDNGISHVRTSIQEYVDEHHQLPVINSFYSPLIRLQKVNRPFSDTGFQTTWGDFPGARKHHISRTLTFSLVVGSELYRATISSPLEGTRDLTAILLTITLVSLLIIVQVSLLLNWFITPRIWHPFYSSLQMLRQFKIDRPEPLSFPKTQTDEFDFMIDNLRSATASGSEAYQLLKEFSENASHEFQTPLAIMRSKMDILIQNEAFSENQSETARTIYSGIDKLSRLSQSLLLITKINNQHFENKTTMDLNSKIQDKLYQFQELWQANNIEVTSKLHKAEIKANDELTEILLNNLLSNATKHNLPGGQIKIELQPRCLTVHNTGRASPLDQKMIFRRFYKEAPVNDSNGLVNDSNGLGLSIIKQICDVSAITPSYRFSEGWHVFQLSW
jgi:signal transduction histidine kinase